MISYISSLTSHLLSPRRRHVEIYWDSNEKSFFIRNISTEIQSYVPSRGSDSGESYRAGGSGSSSDADRGYQGKPKAGTRRKGGSVYLRGVEVTPGGRGMLLKSQSIVQIGSSIFTFVLPSSKSAANKQDVDVSIKCNSCPASILLNSSTAYYPSFSSPFFPKPLSSISSLFFSTLTSLPSLLPYSPSNSSPPSPPSSSHSSPPSFFSHRPLRTNDSPSPCPSRPP